MCMYPKNMQIGCIPLWICKLAVYLYVTYTVSAPHGNPGDLGSWNMSRYPIKKSIVRLEPTGGKSNYKVNCLLLLPLHLMCTVHIHCGIVSIILTHCWSQHSIKPSLPRAAKRIQDIIYVKWGSRFGMTPWPWFHNPLHQCNINPGTYTMLYIQYPGLPILCYTYNI